jgi:hypothetical protein
MAWMLSQEDLFPFVPDFGRYPHQAMCVLMANPRQSLSDIGYMLKSGRPEMLRSFALLLYHWHFSQYIGWSGMKSCELKSLVHFGCLE